MLAAGHWFCVVIGKTLKLKPVRVQFRSLLPFEHSEFEWIWGFHGGETVTRLSQWVFECIVWNYSVLNYSIITWWCRINRMYGFDYCGSSTE